MAFLQALEAARLDRREVHKNIFAALPADKAVAFGVVKPLDCSLFCHVVIRVPFQINYAGRDSEVLRAVLADCKKLLHNRF